MSTSFAGTGIGTGRQKPPAIRPVVNPKRQPTVVNPVVTGAGFEFWLKGAPVFETQIDFNYQLSGAPLGT